MQLERGLARARGFADQTGAMSGLFQRVSRIVRAKWLHASGYAGPEDAADDDEGPADLGTAGRGPADARVRALTVLELGPGAEPDAIRAAYRRLCRRYHPDFYAGDEARSRAANELLAEINRAYELLRKGRG